MNNSKETKLAYEIANALNDMKSIDFHLSLTKKYSEGFLRDKLNTVMAIPEHKITRSRAAYFNHLVKLHGK